MQPGGGNTSVKVGETLLVKGSGTDLGTIGPEGFTRLDLARLGALRQAETMSDAEMMRFMAGCMLAEGPAPSVETPLHSLLPHRVIAHTHDVATMSLTNVPEATAERLVRELFEGDIVYVPYVRPGFPLARAVSGMADRIPPEAVGLALAHLGLVVWGDDAEECRQRLVRLVGRIDEYLEAARRGRRAAGRAGAALDPEERRRRAALLLPVIRGELSRAERVVLHFDDHVRRLAVVIGLVEPRAHRDAAAPVHGLERVVDQVREELAQLVRVTRNLRQVGRDLERDVDGARRCRARRHRHGVAQHRLDVDPLDLEPDRPHELQHLDDDGVGELTTEGEAEVGRSLGEDVFDDLEVAGGLGFELGRGELLRFDERGDPRGRREDERRQEERGRRGGAVDRRDRGRPEKCRRVKPTARFHSLHRCT